MAAASAMQAIAKDWMRRAEKLEQMAQQIDDDLMREGVC
jgi:hypothetical protein